jgi:hypothetical protein
VKELSKTLRTKAGRKATFSAFWEYATVMLHGEQEMSPDQAAQAIQSIVRRRAADLFAQGRVREVDRPVKLQVIRANGLRAADSDGLADPFVVVSVVHRESNQMASNDYSSAYQLAMFKSKPISRTLDPEWGESVLLPHTHGSVEIVFTVLDLDRYITHYARLT